MLSKHLAHLLQQEQGLLFPLDKRIKETIRKAIASPRIIMMIIISTILPSYPMPIANNRPI